MNSIRTTPSITFTALNVDKPQSNNAKTQAYNQADLYILNQLQDLCSSCESDIEIESDITIINDDFGALPVGVKQLNFKNVRSYSDNASLSHAYQFNHIEINIESICNLHSANSQVFLIKIPKQLNYFDYQCHLISSSLKHNKEGLHIIFAGMQRYLPKSFYEVIYKYFEDVDVLPGYKKAKCIHAKSLKSDRAISLQAQDAFKSSLTIPFSRKNMDSSSSAPVQNSNLHPNPQATLELINYPGTFSQGKLDIGTRFLLDNFPELSNASSVLDLACGNGILGIYAASIYNNIKQMGFVDNSGLAIKSAQESLAKNRQFMSKELEANFYHSDCCFGVAKDQNYDACLLNPPFHQEHRVTDHIAKTMIKHAAQRINPNGVLYLVGNRHLGYQQVLSKSFSQVEILAQNKKFCIFIAQLPKHKH